MPPRAATLVLALLALGSAAPARALDLQQQYEEQLVGWAMHLKGLRPEAAPEGKIIERVEIVREEIISRSDPWPGLLNVFHAKTRDHVVRQELLVRPGMRWDSERVEESARNLRQLFILAVARAVPCAGSRPDRVVLLVVTKDLWSIRVDSDFSMVGSTLQLFETNPSEHNFLGRNKLLGLHLRLQQLSFASGQLRDVMAIGQRYHDARILGSRLALYQYARVLLSGDVPCGGSMDGEGAAPGRWCPGRSLGDLEGVHALAWLQRPLYSLTTEWGFDLYGYVDVRQVRQYSQPGPQLRTVELPYAAPLTGAPQTAQVPWVYDMQQLRAAGSFTRSFGRAIKHDVTSGLAAYRYRYAAPGDFPYPADVLAAYADRYLPRSEDIAYFFAAYSTRDTRYLREKNIQAFALSEDFLLGHHLLLELRGGADLVRPEQGFLEALLEAGYRLPLGRDLLHLALEGRSRWQPAYAEGGRQGPFINTRLEARVKNISPPLGIGRLHARLRGVVRHNDLLPDGFSYLGGGDGLRGYPSQAFSGDNLLQVNLEFRTLPLNLFTLHLGLVAFYDGGAAFGGPDPTDATRQVPFAYHHSVGLGLRGLFPQFDKESLRLDVGVPIEQDLRFSGTWFSFSFRQVF